MTNENDSQAMRLGLKTGASYSLRKPLDIEGVRKLFISVRSPIPGAKKEHRAPSLPNKREVLLRPGERETVRSSKRGHQRKRNVYRVFDRLAGRGGAVHRVLLTLSGSASQDVGQGGQGGIA